MSRTDKDRPNWVIRQVENHPIQHDHRHGNCIEQTLTFDPRATCKPTRSDGTDRHPHGRFGPDAEEIHQLHHVPERRRERDELRRLLGAWNAGDPLGDYDFSNHQHRHSAHWLM
ncbi:hypothetical protein [Kribbella endophytica]